MIYEHYNRVPFSSLLRCNLCQLTNSCIKPIKVQVHLFLSFLLKQNFLLCSMFFGIFLGFCTFLHKSGLPCKFEFCDLAHLHYWIPTVKTVLTVSLRMDHFHFFLKRSFRYENDDEKNKNETIVF